MLPDHKTVPMQMAEALAPTHGLSALPLCPTLPGLTTRRTMPRCDLLLKAALRDTDVVLRDVDANETSPR